jgi:hypothetical protein
MPYCTNCGSEVNENQDICLKCGRMLRPTKALLPEDDSGTTGWLVLGFFVPLAGLIIYFLWKDERPLSAKAAGKGALINVIISGAIAIFVFIYFMIIVLSQL